MTRFCLLAISLLLTTLAVSADAELVPKLMFQVTVPDSVNVSDRVEITDVTRDGYAELLLRDADPIVSYSLKQNCVLDFFKRSSDGLKRLYRAEYIDTDDRLDVAEAVLIPGDAGDTFAVICRYGADLYINADTLYSATGLDTTRSYVIDKLFFSDVDKDSQPELYTQYYYMVEIWDDPWSSEPTKYYHYFPVSYSFKDKVTSVPSTLPLDISPFYVSPDSTRSIATISSIPYQTYEPYGHGHGTTITDYFRIYIELASGGINSRGFGCGLTCDYEWNSGNDWYRYASLVTASAGDLLPDTPDLELILLINHQFGAAGYWGSCGARAKQLTLFNLNDPVNWDTVLNAMPYEGPNISQLFVDERFEDRFLSLDSGIVRLHDALSFDVVDQSVVRLAGSWVGYVTLQEGEPPVAAFRDGRTFRFYSLSQVPTDVDGDPDPVLPDQFTLGQPYPNPFNPTVTVPITMPHKGRLRVEVFNVLGQAVSVLYDGKAGPGEMNVVWDATDVPSGVYFLKVVFDDLPKTVSAVLVK